MKKLLIIFTIFIFFSYSEGDSFEPTPALTTHEVQKIINTSATLTVTIKAPAVNTTVTSHGFVYSKSIFHKVE